MTSRFDLITPHEKHSVMNIQVSDAWAPYIRSKIQSGHYGSEDEVLDEALRLMKARDSGLTEEDLRIEELLIEGLDSEPSTPLTSQDWDDIEREAQQLAASQTARKSG
jgi:antitoxin ParD1/3/4